MTNTADNILAGAIQFDVKTGDMAGNLSSALAGIHRLGEKTARIAVLPELWSCGFGKPEMIRQQAEKTPQIMDILGKLAIKYKMIIAGSLPEISEDCLYNTMVVIDKDGTIAGRYRKIHLFSFANEDKAFMPGNRAIVCHTSCGPVGVMICFDLRFPELCRTLAIQGARIVLISAQWPQPRILHWDALLTARAIENQLFIVASNRVGKSGGLTFNGHSQIISPDGKLLSRIIDHPAETAARINFDEIDTLRNRFDCLSQRIPAAYRL